MTVAMLLRFTATGKAFEAEIFIDAFGAFDVRFHEDDVTGETRYIGIGVGVDGHTWPIMFYGTMCVDAGIDFEYIIVC